ncbi:hypothetical protein QN277_013041 [Acacia crassicarpa]|uniref:F-box domain-containing protein n=1 Tax=Acacia crassicarpa TaxID=499986 RepID=A0AAE1N355_9FABA|nr:hypothetical protein QN277_013041 [Acacia crassicarpa]
MKAKSRISLNNFSDAILLHIFSFLEVEDIARLKAVSRRFQTLCISTPSFSFSHNPRHSPNCSCLHVFNFMKTIPRQRPLDLKINLLSFSSYCMKSKHRKLHMRWLCRLFQAFRVDQLSLKYELPSIFKSLPKFQSLKVLKLVMTEHCVSVKLPEIKLASLETLHMEGIETQDLVGEWVSQSFPSLKRLFLYDVNVPRVSTKQLDLIIRSSCLEDLTLKRCCGFKSVRIITDKLRALSYFNCRFCVNCVFGLKKHDEIVVEVSAPNLRSFTWDGPPARLCYDKMAFKSLHKATITGIVFHNLNLGEQLFEAIRWVEILSLDTLVLKDLYGMPLISFGDVRYLEIQVKRKFFYNVDDVLTNFLKRISNLDILALAPDDYYEEPDPFDFKDALRECKKTKWKKIKGLKKVKLATGSMYFAIAFLIGMLKKSCVHMEEMTLIYPSCYHKSVERYLNCLESGSSSLSINLSPPNRKRKRC